MELISEMIGIEKFFATHPQVDDEARKCFESLEIDYRRFVIE